MRLIACLALLATPALASSEDAWAEFRTDVEKACLALVQDAGKVTIEVNPFGTQSYGVALVTLSGEGWEDRMACVYDKVTKVAEMSAAFSQ